MRNMTDTILKNDEKAVFELRSLYENFGYKKYKMSKFEEYDLYARNKSFLPQSDGNVITFNDADGRLLALKPDVTLSIVKNAKEGRQIKEYYNENVYRMVDHEYREFMQVGLECIGDIDLYSTCEVLMLAKKSLAAISGDYVLDISHAAFTHGLVESLDVPYDIKDQLLGCISSKNSHDLSRICKESGISPEAEERLCGVLKIYGPFDTMIERARVLCVNEAMTAALDDLCEIYAFLVSIGEGERMCLDFTLINDMRYYSGIIFKGFINGVAQCVLSGGRYDNLAARMGKKMGAVGFAIYMNFLDLYFDKGSDYDVDILITYDAKADPAALLRMVNTLRGGGRSVRVQCRDDGNIRCRERFYFSERGLETLGQSH